jgi:GAF domain-containing protein
MHFPSRKANISKNQRREALSLLSAKKRALGLIANGASLPEVLHDLCRAIDRQAPDAISAVLLMDPDGKRLWPVAGPRFPVALKYAITPWPIGPDRGSCGAAAFLKQRVIISDVIVDSRWPDLYRGLSVEHRLRASLSEPLISSDGEVLGTFAMYYAEPRLPGVRDLTLIKVAGQIALVATQMKRLQAALQEAEERLHLIANLAPVMIWISGPDKLCTYFNQP